MSAEEDILGSFSLRSFLQSPFLPFLMFKFTPLYVIKDRHIDICVYICLFIYLGHAVT
jgi:hypothetical protein